MARPSKLARKHCLLGVTDKQLSDFFEVAGSTLNKWKLGCPEFSESLKSGKQLANANVAHKLYHRAIGYKHEDVHISNYQRKITITPITKVYAPDTTACISWLKNRDPENWRDKPENTEPPPAPDIGEDYTLKPDESVPDAPIL